MTVTVTFTDDDEAGQLGAVADALRAVADDYDQGGDESGDVVIAYRRVGSFTIDWERT
jgi:hypothetical protein